MTHTLENLTVVEAWQNAVNAADIEGLFALSQPDIELLGPRGSASGHDILRVWLERSGLSLQARQCFARDDTVVVDQRGVWNQEGEVSEAQVASVFRVREGKVAYLARYDSLQEAWQASGLGPQDAVPEA